MTTATDILLIGSNQQASLHDIGPDHPEQPSRIRAVLAGADQSGLGSRLTRWPGRAAQRQELLRVHGPAYLDSLCDFIVGGGGDLDPDTPVVSDSWDAALYSAGSGLEAVECLQRGEAAAAFVATRPPGHHASASVAMGFCLLNNVAIAAASLIQHGERVVIIDWDVHHGNGTQDIFWDDPRVLYISMHEWPSYPGTGHHRETGGPCATGLTVNIPLPAGATGDAARAAFEQIVTPAAEEFAPTWVLVSCGFDAHRDDPLGSLAWSAGDYADLSRSAQDLAPLPGRLVFFLEGGYDPRALSLSTGAVLSALAGGGYLPEPPTTGGPGVDLVAHLARVRNQTKELDRWT